LILPEHAALPRIQLNFCLPLCVKLTDVSGGKSSGITQQILMMSGI
jgi:hypothetical protein